jgi:arylsulfatase A-like enzyme
LRLARASANLAGLNAFAPTATTQSTSWARAVFSSAAGGFMAGLLLALVDLGLTFLRIPMRPAPHDRAAMAFWSLISVPPLTFVLGAGLGLLSLSRPRRGRLLSAVRAFFLLASLLLAAYGIVYFLFRHDWKFSHPSLTLLTLTLLWVAVTLLGRIRGLAERRMRPGALAVLAFSWIAALAASFLLSRPPTVARAPGGPPRQLVVLVTLDTLRADALGNYGHPGGQTPNLDNLAREGALFLHAQAASSWTLPSHASMFTGLSMARHGANGTSLRLGTGFPTVAEVFRDSGFTTRGVVSAVFVNSTFGFDRGFDRFNDAASAPWYFLALPTLLRRLPRLFPSLDMSAERRAGESVRLALEELEGGGRLFLWLHLFDPHTDYDPPAPFRPASADIRAPFDGRGAALGEVNTKRLAFPSAAEIRNLRALYQGEVAYLDSEIGRLVGEVRRRGLANVTSILFVADHGEAFGEHGSFLHTSLHQETLHVPFILWAPGRVPAGLRVPDVVRGIDVAPTLAELGLSGSARPIGSGESVLPLLHGREAAPRAARSDRNDPTRASAGVKPESSLLVWPWKFYRNTESGSKLFNLEEDPGERVDRSRERPDLVARMKADLERGDKAEGDGPRRILDPETTRRLKSLGYLQ